MAILLNKTSAHIHPNPPAILSQMFFYYLWFSKQDKSVIISIENCSTVQIKSNDY